MPSPNRDEITFQLKQLSTGGIATAVNKAEQYRALNEPWEAESICRDVLAVDAEQQKALTILILSLTDQFTDSLGRCYDEARNLLPRLQTEFEQKYYAGIIAERRAKVHVYRGTPGSGAAAYDGLRDAMECYDAAQQHSPPGDENALLRWNTCARLIMQHDHVRPAAEDAFTPFLE